MIDYKNFPTDCSNIIEPYLKLYGFKLHKHNKEDFINYYTNDNYYVMISMLENFPQIGVSWAFLDMNLKLISPSLINSLLNINSKEEVMFYKEYQSSNNLNDYASEMQYTIAVMEKFYKPILTEDIKLDDVQWNT